MQRTNFNKQISEQSFQANYTYSVNEYGAIEVNSLKNTPLFNYIEDKDSNGLLEGDELLHFFNKIKQDEILNKCTEIDESNTIYTYYIQHDRSGDLIKKCIFTKEEKDMMTFIYKNGKPVRCINYMSSGDKDLINLNTGYIVTIKPNNKSLMQFLNQKNCQMLKRIALDKPAKMTPVAEFFYRLINWDWGDW